jgi:secondary thiamine-phosphate synthase enzyme
MSVNRIEVINVVSSTREQIIDITGNIAEFAEESGGTGIISVFVPHTTAAVTINENADPDVKRDILMGLNDIVRQNLPYRHAEGNSPAHLKTLLTGTSVNLFFDEGKLSLGTWQGIYFCEFDGPRARKVFVKIL